MLHSRSPAAQERQTNVVMVQPKKRVKEEMKGGNKSRRKKGVLQGFYRLVNINFHEEQTVAVLKLNLTSLANSFFSNDSEKLFFEKKLSLNNTAFSFISPKLKFLGNIPKFKLMGIWQSLQRVERHYYGTKKRKWYALDRKKTLKERERERKKREILGRKKALTLPTPSKLYQWQKQKLTFASYFLIAVSNP